MCLLRESDYWVAQMGHPIFSFNLRSSDPMTLSLFTSGGRPFWRPLLYVPQLRVGGSADPIFMSFMLEVANLPPPIYSNPAISPGLMSGLIGVIGSDDPSFTWFILGWVNLPTLNAYIWTGRNCPVQYQVVVWICWERIGAPPGAPLSLRVLCWGCLIGHPQLRLF